MRLAAYLSNGNRHVGVVSPDGSSVRRLDLTASQAELGVLSVVSLLAEGKSLPDQLAAEPLSREQLIAPIPQPRRNLWCVGRNYHAHAKELSGSVFKANNPDPQSWPIVFTKVPESVIGPNDPVHLPAGVSDQIDYEAELTIIIGKGGRNITRDEAMSHVFGYTIVNDVTARDVQMRHQQWDLGKSFDTFCPMGPWIVTADELDATNTRVQCWVNDELRQDASTADLIFDLPTLIETCSRGITLLPGDIIATGTPAGVGMGFKPPRYLQHGDVVRIAIEGIGEIRNRFVSPDAG